MSYHPNMSMERVRQLLDSGDAPTEEEFNDGWHYCYDWDLLLIGEDMPETKHCYCHPKYIERRNVQDN